MLQSRRGGLLNALVTGRIYQAPAALAEPKSIAAGRVIATVVTSVEDPSAVATGVIKV